MAASPVLFVYYPPLNDDSWPGVPGRHITEADWASFTIAQRRTVENATTQEGYTRRKVWVHRDLVDETEEERAQREAEEAAAREAYDRARSLVRYGQIETMIEQLEVLPPAEEFVQLRADVDAVADVPPRVEAVETAVGHIQPIVNTVAKVVSLTHPRFGAVYDGVTDNFDAIESALNELSATGGGVLDLGPGVLATRGGHVNRPNVVMRGHGMGVSTLYLLTDGALITRDTINRGGTAFFGIEDVTLHGYGDRNMTQGGGEHRLVYIGNTGYQRVWFHRVQAIYSRQMSLTGMAAYAEAKDCVVEYSLRDAINLTGAKRAIVTGNEIRYCADDAIALHLSGGQHATGDVAFMPSVVSNNLLWHTFGIKCLGAANAVISNNSGRFLYGYGINVGVDTSFNEGARDSLGVVIGDNTLLDIIDRAVIHPSSTTLCTGIFLTPVEARAASGQTAPPGQVIDGEGWSVAVNGAWDRYGTTAPHTGSWGVMVSGNTLMQTLDNMTLLSDAGFGQGWTVNGWADPTFPARSTPVRGTVGDGRAITMGRGILSALVSGNVLYGFRAGVSASAPRRPSWLFTGNTLTRLRLAFSITEPSGQTVHGDIRIANNLIDLDPLVESPVRNLVGGEPDGRWDGVKGTDAVLLWAVANIYGVVVEHNHIRNTFLLHHTTGDHAKVVIQNNTIFADTTPGGLDRGVQLSDADEMANRVILTDCDPRSATYGEIFGSLIEAAAAMPTSGAFPLGWTVRSTNQTVTDGEMTTGWVRRTSGSNHVLGTDWVRLTAKAS